MIAVVLALLAGSTGAMAAKPGKIAGHAHEGPATVLRQITAKLDLTDDQKPQVDQVLTDLEQKLQALKQEAKGAADKEAVRSKGREVLSDARLKLLAILTPEQKTRFRHLAAEQRAERKTEKKAEATTQPSKQD
jgi:Spy/CpxP family protein refolding chaperone